MTTVTLDRTPATTRDAASEAETCTVCGGDGWADPWEAFGGAPPLTWCRACLGAGLEDCDGCDGYGAVPEPISCPRCDGELFPAT